MPHRALGPMPTQFLWKPAQLSTWHNLDEGVCVTSEEAFAKACHDPEIFITDDTVQTWATLHGVLDGAVVSEVLDTMVDQGFLQDGVRYNDGTAVAVDWTNAMVLQNAIFQGPVKIGVAADQLENAVVGDPPVNGWFATGFQSDSNTDHCVSLCGYGTIVWLAAQLGVEGNLNVDGRDPGYALFTWGSIGVIDVPSMLAITSEAWLRSPSTIIVK